MKNSALADLVQRRRWELKLTQRQLAEASGSPITNNYVAQVERGAVAAPGPEYLSALARGLRLEETVLLQAMGHLQGATKEESPALDTDRGHEVLAWAAHRSQDPVTAPPDSDIPSLVRELTPDLKLADERLDPGSIATIRNILQEQIKMLIRLAATGKLPPSEYHPEGETATRK